jgi:hypothetical protein
MLLGSVSMQCAQAHHQRLHLRRSRQADPVA